MTLDAIQKLRDRVREVGYIHEAVQLMEWDLQTGAPKKGHALRAESLGALASRAHELSTSAEVGAWLSELTEAATNAQLTEVDKALVRVEKKAYDLMHHIPRKLFGEYQQLVSHATSVWEDAKEQNDFSSFQPYLEKIVQMKREFIGYWGEANHPNHPYDTLLDQFEPGMTVSHVDEVFGELRKNLVPLVDTIRERGPVFDMKRLQGIYPIANQEQLGKQLLREMGYDFAGGRLDQTVHPFESTLNRYDVRVTTHYDESDVRDALFSTIHEGGHALYEQGISTDLIGTSLSGGTSMGIHESQSRFWENMIGRSRPFWDRYFPLVTDAFKERFEAISVADFYRYINHVEPSLIRTRADEVTYNLHVMVRYELEKAIFGGQLEVADLPEAWREKMQEYLGITPIDDTTGVLQDVHWSAGLFGYFPSYALGNLYAAQFYYTLRSEMPDFDDLLRQGNLHPIREWLRIHIHQYGSMLEPTDIVRLVTGEDLSGQYLVQYLNDKFRPLYGL